MFLACIALPASSQTSGIASIYGGFGPGLLDYQGTLGTAKIGLTFVLDKNTEPHGSYFYFKHLKDIPLKGTFAPDGFELQEFDSSGRVRGIFHLRISTVGIRKIERPLTLGNTSMLIGTWTSADGTRTLPVKLKQIDWVRGTDESRYGAFGSNLEIERKVRQFYDAVQQGNRRAASDAVSYPLPVNSLKLRIANKQQFLADYGRIFTASFVRCLANYPPHNLFVNAQGIMFGRGELWFNEKGLISINPCTSQ